MWLRSLISCATLAAAGACTPPTDGPVLIGGPVAAQGLAYEGVETQAFEGDLVQFRAAVSRAPGDDIGRAAAAAYSECAAAQYALIRGYGFARHLRTNVYEEAGLWRADAVYTISAALPRGLKTIDAEVVALACRENGIPTV